MKLAEKMLNEGNCWVYLEAYRDELHSLCLNTFSQIQAILEHLLSDGIVNADIIIE